MFAGGDGDVRESCLKLHEDSDRREVQSRIVRGGIVS